MTKEREERNLKLLHGHAKVLYFLWLYQGFKGNIPELSKRLGYPDDRYIRGIIDELKEDDRIERKIQRDGSEWFKITWKGERQIDFLTLPTWAFRALLAIGMLTTLYGVGVYNGTFQFSAIGEIVVGAATLALAGYLIEARRRSFEALWPPEEEGQSSPRRGRKDPQKGQASS